MGDFLRVSSRVAVLWPSVSDLYRLRGGRDIQSAIDAHYRLLHITHQRCDASVTVYIVVANESCEGRPSTGATLIERAFPRSR